MNPIFYIHKEEIVYINYNIMVFFSLESRKNIVNNWYDN